MKYQKKKSQNLKLMNDTSVLGAVKHPVVHVLSRLITCNSFCSLGIGRATEPLSSPVKS